jgi:rod shape-determining protein MreC
MALHDRGFSRHTMGSALLVCLSLLILIVSTQSLAGVPERIGFTVVSFFQKGFNAVGDFFTDTINSVATLRKLESSHKELLARVESLVNLERSFSELKRENERLKEQLGFQKDAKYKTISARIIAKDPENLYSTFMLNKGTAQGVVKNQAVIAFQDGVEGLVGRVLEVGRTNCLVSPIYDSNAFVAVRLERSRYDGLASGTGTLDEPIVVKYIKKRAKEEIQFGDLVVTSGLKSLYPAGISVGRVIAIRDLEYLTSLEIDIEPVIDFGRIEFVFIVHDDLQDDATVEKGR